MPGLHSKYYDQDMRPLLEVVQDTGGRHDAFALACAARYYESHGYFGHDNCSDNLSRVMAPHGCQAAQRLAGDQLFLQYRDRRAASRTTLDEPWSRPGDYVLLRAMTDLLCGSTSCPDDIDPGQWLEPDRYPCADLFRPAQILASDRQTHDARFGTENDPRDRLPFELCQAHAQLRRVQGLLAGQFLRQGRRRSTNTGPAGRTR